MAQPAPPLVLIVGGGFAGLAAARALARADCRVMVIDRRNHHVFQPLLYQVATAALSPAEISAPIRAVLRGQRNCQVALAEALSVDVPHRRLVVRGGSIGYDFLVLAAGATHAYFGHDEWAPLAPGLKGLDDATELRRRILLAFESAEYEESDAARRAALTFGIVGGGPTGVELAGAIKEIAGRTLPKDYRNIDTRTTRVILFQGADRILPEFPHTLSMRAQRDLERMGVEVRVHSNVTDVTRDGVFVGTEFIRLRNVFWAAGVKASPLGASLGVPVDRAGRVIVGPDLSIPGHPEVFVVGDGACAACGAGGPPVPGVAPAAIQMGRFVGRLLAKELDAKELDAKELDGRRGAGPRPTFVYRDKGSMAVIGKARAVAAIGRLRFGGFIAWLLWSGIHISFLVGFRNRAAVLASWFWSWLLNSRDARLITGEGETPPLLPAAAPTIAGRNEHRPGVGPGGA